MKISAVMMCSGFSRRMGKNKLLMEFNGRRMFEYTVDVLLNCDFDEIIVVTTYEEIALYCRDLTVIMNNAAAEGIAASVRLGAERAADSDAIMFFTADQPFMTTEVIDRLTGVFKAEKRITIPVCGGRYKNPVIFPSRYRNELMRLTGDEGGKRVYMSHKHDISEVLFDDSAPFIDFDTEEEIKKFQQQ